MRAETGPALTAPMRSGSTSQGLLVTLLGDYWFGRTVYIPSSALVALLGQFGVSDQGARAALSRVVRSGSLEGTKAGRRTAYRLTPDAARRMVATGRGIMRFTAATPDSLSLQTWDGRWTIVAYSLPAEQAEDRRRIRRRLRELGFGPLQDGMWVSPYRRAAHASAALDGLGVSGYTVLENATVATGSALDPRAAWRLDGLATTYRDQIVRLRPPAKRLRRGSIAPPEALVVRTEAMESWRALTLVDPILPPELLPAAWPGWKARVLFAEVYDGLGALAEERVREIVEPHSAAAAAAVRHDIVAAPR
jgi:phenylacetic acid degradation operon negative regulatory protein